MAHYPFCSSVPVPPSRIALVPPPPDRATPQAVTRPELPAVRPPAPVRFPGEARESEEPGRITRVSAPPALDTSRDRILLLRLDGAEGGQLVSLGIVTTTVGRDVDNALCIDDGGVSRHHARIVWKDGVHQLEDLDSRNGTYLKGRPVQRAVLTDGDLVQFGPHACFRYTVTDALQEQLLKQLYESSTLDPLTGICNRRHFEARMESELSFARRHATDLAVVMLDIDFFKRINDTHGHLVGDSVIRHIASVIRGQIRAEDLVARFGGEEFVVLLRDTDVRGAVRVAERVRTTIEVLPARSEGRIIQVTLSAGCAALLEPDGPDGSGLVKRADERLYRAKTEGRNRVIGASR